MLFRSYQYVFRTYPEYFAPTLKHKLGPNLYRLSQIVSGRQALATLDTRRMRGRKLTDVFGDWVVPEVAGVS